MQLSTTFGARRKVDETGVGAHANAVDGPLHGLREAVRRCEAPEQPKSRRGGAIECRECILAAPARRDGLYVRRDDDIS